ncbi:bifunctional 2-polyprenyl-6-hydroxyphenol methylase/3-demethylubiquinol 3-O-methyltransferase UbiG [Algibacter sp. L4_22]|uniref:class I SAM-dependent methyltransferase n=1 Tax=Algibacter sp. L4_22 TaxID=2942477 RepID=UPI00201B5590|nr:class I SAM-dependent methyltransferase [Algibacter sp. L4_22]MCL5127226.1 class I SAM-dependent methyltransferase [Algibacter sp. L4_22]
MKEMWDNRYSNEDYAYGILPNDFFKYAIDKYKLTGKILLPAEGEGRNAVYAAKKGLNVTAFDISNEGKKKALKLAEKENVKINYEIGNLFDLDLINEQFDSAIFIYAHLPPSILSNYHKKIAELVKPNGYIILEGFSTGHLELRKQNPQVGGPDKLEMLFSIDTIKRDFPDFDIIELEDVETELNEGKFHIGTAKVIRFVGKKQHTIQPKLH